METYCRNPKLFSEVRPWRGYPWTVHWRMGPRAPFSVAAHLIMTCLPCLVQASDVWAFAVTVWEMFSYGEVRTKCEM